MLERRLRVGMTDGTLFSDKMMFSRGGASG